MYQKMKQVLFLAIISLMIILFAVPVSADQNNGWFKYNGKYYYMVSGSPAKGWKKVGNGYYYLDPSSGELKTGWVKSGGKYYYMDPSTGTLKTGFVKSGGKYYYCDPATGALKTGWVKASGNYYYFDPTTGAMKTGWVKSGGYYYYFNPYNGALQIYWLYYNDNFYYLNPTTGRVTTGWAGIDGDTYFFSNTGAMVTGWQNIGGYWYLFLDGGELYTNTVYFDDSVVYIFDDYCRFVSESNYFYYYSVEYEQDKVNVTPYCLYFRDGTLYLEILITNGYDVPVKDIQVTNLTIADKNGKTIVSCPLNMDTPLTLVGKSYIELAFYYNPDYVYNWNPDFNYLSWSFNTTYNFVY